MLGSMITVKGVVLGSRTLAGKKFMPAGDILKMTVDGMGVCLQLVRDVLELQGSR